MTSSESPRLKLYTGFIWIGSDAGQPVRIWATDAKDAQAKLEAEYGTGHEYSLHNEDDASRPR